MALVTALGGLIAIRRDAFVLAVLGLVGGFATPWLLSTGENHPYALFSYVALLDASMLVVAARRSWVSLPALALGGTVVLYGLGQRIPSTRPASSFALVVAALLGALPRRERSLAGDARRPGRRSASGRLGRALRGPLSWRHS
jgi:uncharacterized membrane protein